jgi:hypothetical protein
MRDVILELKSSERTDEEEVHKIKKGLKEMLDDKDLYNGLKLPINATEARDIVPVLHA